MSFDLIADGDGVAIEDLAVDVRADCFDEDDNESQLVVHLSGIAGKVSGSGGYYIDITPDEETEYDVAGDVGAGKARLDVTIAGRFDPDGNPNPSGPLFCDSWGAIYEASKQ